MFGPSFLMFLSLALPAAARQDAPPLGRAAQRAIVDSVDRLLATRYVDEAIAPRLGAHLQRRLAAGAYATVTAPGAFAQALTRDLRSVVQDLHLRLNYEPTREFVPAGAVTATPAPAEGAAPPIRRTSRIDGRDSAAIARTNFGFVEASLRSGNVGYLRLDRFVPLDYSRATAMAAMTFLSQADALVIDLRRNIGGSPDLVALLLTWLTDGAPRRFFASRSRVNGTSESSTAGEFAGRRRPDVPVYVLIGPETASAAEMFAYGARQLQRATLVGMRTAGAGNGGIKLSVGSGLALFVPERQVTLGPGWEATGVAPDVATDTAAALATALRLADERVAASTARRVDDLALLDDEFDDASSLARWTDFHAAEGWPSLTKRMTIADGALRLEPTTSGWYSEWHAPFLFKSVTGDFEATVRLRATGLDGGVPSRTWSLAGLMARAPRTATAATWTPRGENWLFITAGIGSEPDAPAIETKTTVNSDSRLRLDPGCPAWMELRLTRRGAAFDLASRCDGGAWIARAHFDRADLPATLQVGIAAYTDWDHIVATHGQDAHAFNTKGVPEGTPDLRAEVDWIRFRRP